MAQISLDSIKKSKNTAIQFTIKSTRLIRLLKQMVKICADRHLWPHWT